MCVWICSGKYMKCSFISTTTPPRPLSLPPPHLSLCLYIQYFNSNRRSIVLWDSLSSHTLVVFSYASQFISCESGSSTILQMATLSINKNLCAHVRRTHTECINKSFSKLSIIAAQYSKNNNNRKKCELKWNGQRFFVLLDIPDSSDRVFVSETWFYCTCGTRYQYWHFGSVTFVWNVERNQF